MDHRIDVINYEEHQIIPFVRLGARWHHYAGNSQSRFITTHRNSNRVEPRHRSSIEHPKAVAKSLSSPSVCMFIPIPIHIERCSASWNAQYTDSQSSLISLNRCGISTQLTDAQTSGAFHPGLLHQSPPHRCCPHHPHISREALPERHLRIPRTDSEIHLPTTTH